LRLSELLKEPGIAPDMDKEVTGLTADSRHVKPGYLFAALSGTVTDGRAFIASAIERGAIAILSDLSYDISCDIPVYCHKVATPRHELAILSDRFEGGKPDMIIAITGTNGKTSVAHFIRNIWQKLGLSAASIGTLGVVANDRTEDLHYTTPDPVLLHQVLKRLDVAAVTHVVIEASSHGLDQYRVDAAGIRVAGFTNFSRDHLDYHKDADEYLKAKLGLVSRVVVEGGTVVLNAESDVFPIFRDAARVRGLTIISYGHADADLCLLSVQPHAGGQLLKISVFDQVYTVDLPLIGDFQAMNILCALGMVIASGGDAVAAVASLSGLGNVPGRMEKICELPTGAAIYVDYAHTPDALKTVLAAIRPHTEGQVIVVFGCGGDRDKGKRPQMGQIAAELADIAIVTDDNPRSEVPADIRAEIMQACPDALEIGDRQAAIIRAMEMAKAGDVVLVAGKGHEDGQVIGDQVIPFNDKDVVLANVPVKRGAV